MRGDAEKILQALRRAGDTGLSTPELLQISIRAQARIGELRADGYQIRTDTSGPCAQYYLESDELVKKPGVVIGARVFLREDGVIEIKPYQENSDAPVDEFEKEQWLEGILDFTEAMFRPIMDNLQVSWSN